MGKKGAKMNEFNIFRDSILDCKNLFGKFEGLILEECGEYEFEPLRDIFEKLNPMYSGSKIVGVSKVLAHYLPNIFAPVDRTYTFQFINQKSKDISMPRNWGEMELLRDIHLKLLNPIASSEVFKKQALQWMENQNDFPWDTSIPKIIDNLIIGKLKKAGLVDE